MYYKHTWNKFKAKSLWSTWIQTIANLIDTVCTIITISLVLLVWKQQNPAIGVLIITSNVDKYLFLTYCEHWHEAYYIGIKNIGIDF